MKVLFTLLFIVFSANGFSQQQNVRAELIDSVLLEADVFIGYDKFDHVFYIKDNVLFKVKDQTSIAYKNVALGKISKVDLLNPLKILVFFERFNTVVILDNQLNEILKVNFSEIKNPIVNTKTGIASQHQIWAFDEVAQQIYLYDTLSGHLKPVGIPLAERMLFYHTDFNSFEWLDTSKRWYSCSIFGTIKELKMPFEFDAILYASAEVVIYKKGENMFAYSKKSEKISSIENVDKTFESLAFKNQILSIFTNRGISNYKITLP
ncbi:hypothetical protein [Flavobacterium sp.]|uniref:hypothetical protein n=1 Tax=Flavobacterium sp. TaxID=239 RepID=UPI0026100A5D|nr:hypothetical protein [Flavobacterium sp.]MDD3004179.1 hypothetical protein [Flavobacterium sp.]